LPDPQPSNLSPRVAERSRCPQCQSRMEIQHITSARSGFEHWTLRCTKCGLIHEAQVNVDPVKSDAYRLGAQRPEGATARTMT
jgi:uncharacterized Zn finger protein